MNNNIVAFEAISNFVTELSSVFDNHSLKLYERLISKTTPSHDKFVKKHLELFKDFCVINREGIVDKNSKKFKQPKIEYSTKIYIDFLTIFNDADKQTTKAIWNHLLTISALVDPESNAKAILKSFKDSNEENIFTDVFSKVEEHITPGMNPMQAVSVIMSSGVFTDLLSSMNSGMQDGSLDLGKLLGSVQKMCGDLNVNMAENKPIIPKVEEIKDDV